MRNWGSLIANITNGLIVLLNVAVGLLNFHLHHRVPGLVNLAVAAVGLTILSFGLRGARRRLAVAERELQEAMELTPAEDRAAMAKAIANLHKVAKATGAKISKLGFDEAEIKIKGQTFHISHRHACCTRKNGERASTCLNYGHFIPVPEEIAAALLLLKHDPTIFDRWKKQDKYYA